jgi:hypothetical protein
VDIMLSKQRIGIASGLVSSVLYVATDLVASRRYEGYSIRDQWFSELTADGAPTRTFLALTNSIPYTALVTAFSVGILHWLPDRPGHKATGLFLLGYAASGAAGAMLFPMQTREAIRVASDDSQNMGHITATMIMSVSLMLAMISARSTLSNRWRTYTYATLATMLFFGALTSRQAGDIVAGLATPWSGVYERVNIYAIMLWIALLSAGLLKSAGSIARPATPTARHAHHAVA